MLMSYSGERPLSAIWEVPVEDSGGSGERDICRKREGDKTFTVCVCLTHHHHLASVGAGGHFNASDCFTFPYYVLQ